MGKTPQFTPATALLLHADAEGFHLAVEVGAFEAECLGGARDISVALV